MSVDVQVRDQVGVLTVRGDLTAGSEAELTAGYEEVAAAGVRSVVLDFSAVEFLNSGGIGLLVTLLVRANRQGRRLLAFGLSEHYRAIFEVTRLDEAISIHPDAATAFAAAGAGAVR